MIKQGGGDRETSGEGRGKGGGWGARARPMHHLIDSRTLIISTILRSRYRLPPAVALILPSGTPSRPADACVMLACVHALTHPRMHMLVRWIPTIHAWLVNAWIPMLVKWIPTAVLWFRLFRLFMNQRKRRRRGLFR